MDFRIRRSTRDGLGIASVLFAFMFLSVFASVFAADDIDLGYDPAAGRPISNDQGKIFRMSDGRILVFGYEPFSNIDGVSRSKIARLNPDGTLDPSFSCDCNTFTFINGVAEQPDGKIIIGGSYSNVSSPRLARINPDGSRDFSFVSPYTQQGGGFSYTVDVWDVAPDGKIYTALRGGGFRASFTYLRRLNQDGSFDTSFEQLSFDGWGLREFLTNIHLLPDGKLFVSGKHSKGFLFRLNNDGSKDFSFEPPNLVAAGAPSAWPIVSDFGIQSNGKIVILGAFISVNGIAKQNFARLNPAGNVDLTFSDAFSTSGAEMEILSDDRIILKNNAGESNLSVLDSNGNPEKGFSTGAVRNWLIDDLERVIYIGDFAENGTNVRRISKLLSDGSVNPLFHKAAYGFAGDISELELQSDGKLLATGYFDFVDGAARRGIARINTDGSIDQSFDPGSGINGTVYEITTQPDGKILIGGNFSAYNGVARTGLARINADGSIDSAFFPVVENAVSAPSVSAIVVMPNGKILIGGFFTLMNGVSRGSLAMLNSDGTLDTSFDPLLTNAGIASIVIQTDGKILIGGSFSGVGGFNRSNLARLNADGTVDTSFDAGSIGTVGHLIIQPDGKLLVLRGGDLLRRNPDGTPDTSFNLPVNLGALDFELEADGQIIVVGGFTSIDGNPRNRIARFRSNGDLDFAFLPNGADATVNEIVRQNDGKYVVGGAFGRFENIERSSLARFTAPAFQRITQFDFDEDGKADISLFRPSENKWYVLQSSDLQTVDQVFAIPGDKPVPADYDGDGKTDFAIFRASLGDWWSLSSASGAQVFGHWGESGDIPLPSDFDGDGRMDYVVYRPSINWWYRINSAGVTSDKYFGSQGDKPLIGDFDGDRRSDPAIFRPSTGDWWWQSSIDNIQRATHWGVSTDIPAPADYDGDGKTDFAVFRPSNGAWYIYNSADLSFTILPFGLAGDKPAPADYDGDGKVDIAVYRPSTGIWYLLKSTEGFTAIRFGAADDIPVPGSFLQ